MMIFSQTSLQAGWVSQWVRINHSVGPPGDTKLAVAPQAGVEHESRGSSWSAPGPSGGRWAMCT